MSFVYLVAKEPEGRTPIVLHWIGPGWYGPVQHEGVVHEYFIDRDVDENRAISEARVAGLGTPHCMDNMGDYPGWSIGWIDSGAADRAAEMEVAMRGS